jgi:hypothetical protein
MSFHDLWDSAEKLGRLIVLANWGIAGTLLVAFACTVIVIKASNRKDEIMGAEDLRKAGQIASLENSNLALRGQVANLEINAATANKDLAGLQKSASDAKTAQQKVEIDLAKQQEKAAIAERSLLELQERIKPRTISADQRATLIRLLTPIPKLGSEGKIVVRSVAGDGEADFFAGQIVGVLKASGFTTEDQVQSVYGGGNPIGSFISVHNIRAAPAYVVSIQRAFQYVGIIMGAFEKPDEVPEGNVVITVGNKPNRP